MAASAKPGNTRHVDRVVKTRDSGNIDLRLVEHALAMSNRPAPDWFIVLARGARPQGRRVEIEDIGVEGRAGRIEPDRVIHADVELGELQRERGRTAVRAVGMQIVGEIVGNLSW